MQSPSPRENRYVAKDLAERLGGRGAAVFYDESYLADLWGRRLDQEFAWVFGAGTRFFVPIVSAFYAERSWPQYEWAVGSTRGCEEARGIYIAAAHGRCYSCWSADTVSYLDLRRHSVDKVADLLLEKLGSVRAATARGLGEQTWVGTLGLTVQDLLDSENLPLEAPSDYAGLCDWLAEDLEWRLARTSLVDPRITEDARSGETLSVRVAFEWGPAKGPLTFGDLGWWALLELQPHNHVY